MSERDEDSGCIHPVADGEECRICANRKIDAMAVWQRPPKPAPTMTATSEKVEELIARVEDLAKDSWSAHDAKAFRDSAALLSSLNAQVEEMRKALEPFAKMADQMSATKTGVAWGYDHAQVTYEDFRAALSALEAK